MSENTGVLPDVSKLSKAIDKLSADNASLKAQVAQLTSDLETAQRDRDAAQERAEKLAVAVDAGVAVEREPGDVRTGDVVLYRLKDVVTGDTLEGPGFVTEAREGGLTVAPLSPLPLTLVHDDVELLHGEA